MSVFDPTAAGWFRTQKLTGTALYTPPAGELIYAVKARGGDAVIAAATGAFPANDMDGEVISENDILNAQFHTIQLTSGSVRLWFRKE